MPDLNPNVDLISAEELRSIFRRMSDYGTAAPGAKPPYEGKIHKVATEIR
jgi:hypothetical protein